MTKMRSRSVLVSEPSSRMLDGKHDAGGEDADAYPIVPEAPVEETGKRDGEQGEQQVVAHGPSVGMGTLPGGVVCLGPFLAGVGDDAEGLAVGADEVLVLLGFEEDDRQHGDDGGNEEAPSEVVRVARLAKIAADQRGEEGTHVDTHIEDSVGGIQPFVTRLVELPHQGGDGGLEAAVAQYKESQSAVHQPMRKLTRLQHRGTGKHQELADCHHHGPPEDGTADAPVFVGDVAAD